MFNQIPSTVLPYFDKIESGEQEIFAYDILHVIKLRQKLIVPNGMGEQ